MDVYLCLCVLWCEQANVCGWIHLWVHAFGWEIAEVHVWVGEPGASMTAWCLTLKGLCLCFWEWMSACTPEFVCVFVCTHVHSGQKICWGRFPVPRTLRKEAAGRCDKRCRVDRKWKEERQSSLMLCNQVKGCCGKSEVLQIQTNLQNSAKSLVAQGRNGRSELVISMCWSAQV